MTSTPPGPTDPLDPPDFTPVGEPVCWLENVCPECGALVDSPLPRKCWRCGNVVEAT